MRREATGLAGQRDGVEKEAVATEHAAHRLEAPRPGRNGALDFSDVRERGASCLRGDSSAPRGVTP